MTRRRVPPTITSGALALAAVALTVTACSTDHAPTGLTQKQCDGLLDQRERLEVFTDDDWAFSRSDPLDALLAIQTVMSEVYDIDADTSTPATEAAIGAAVDAFLAHQVLAREYIDDPPQSDDPRDAERQAEVDSELDEALKDC